jgi:hypothetical protein
MNDEIESLRKHNVWTLKKNERKENDPSGRWVFKTKLYSNGEISRFKARFVARGYSQIEGIDFFETFSPVVWSESVRILILLASTEDWDIEQFDLKTAFLYGPLTEEVYMTQPEGFHDGSTKVCRLRKGLYGLKQSPRQ